MQYLVCMVYYSMCVILNNVMSSNPISYMIILYRKLHFDVHSTSSKSVFMAMRSRKAHLLPLAGDHRRALVDEELGPSMAPPKAPTKDAWSTPSLQITSAKDVQSVERLRLPRSEQPVLQSSKN